MMIKLYIYWTVACCFYLISGVGSRYTEESSGIRVKNITLDDDGEYTCRAEVEADGRYSERKISVLVHSEFSLRP